MGSGLYHPTFVSVSFSAYVMQPFFTYHVVKINKDITISTLQVCFLLIKTANTSQLWESLSGLNQYEAPPLLLRSQTFCPLKALYAKSETVTMNTK